VFKSYTDDVYTLDGDNTTSEIEPNIAFAVSFGGRAGVEILAGPKVGFAIDFIIRPLRHDVTWEEEVYNSTSMTYEMTYTDHKVVFPLIGVGASINFYF